MTTTPDITALTAAVVAAEESGGDADTAALVLADAYQEARDDDRAEFIRVQVALTHETRFEPPEHYQCDVCGNTPDENGELQHGKGCYVLDEDGGGSEWVGSRRVWIDLTNRRDALLAANEADWRRAGGQCPECEGTGDARKVKLSHSFERCQECRGTGDAGGLFKAFEYSIDTEASFERARVQWRRGLPYAVEVPRLANVLEEGFRNCPHLYEATHSPECPLCHGAGSWDVWRPTPWAAAVAQHRPTVRAFVCGGLVPEEWNIGAERFVWYRDSQPWSRRPQATLPSVVFDGLRGGTMHYARESRGFATREAAVTAAAEAVMRVVRSMSAPVQTEVK